MLKPYIMAEYPNHIFFKSKLEFEKLLIEVLTKIAQHRIIIDDCIMAADTDIYDCHSGIGDFTVFYDGDVDIYTPSKEFAEKLVQIFN